MQNQFPFVFNVSPYVRNNSTKMTKELAKTTTTEKRHDRKFEIPNEK